MLNHPLGSNIQHILEDIDLESEDSVGMADDNLGPSTVVAAQTPQKPLSLFQNNGPFLELRLRIGLIVWLSTGLRGPMF
jgi:hypothetical protein